MGNLSVLITNYQIFGGQSCLAWFRLSVYPLVYKLLWDGACNHLWWAEQWPPKEFRVLNPSIFEYVT